MRRLSRIRRMVLSAALCLAGGAVATVMVAWGFGLWGTINPSLDNYHASGTAWPAPPPAGWPEPDQWMESRGVGLSSRGAWQNLAELARTRRLDPSVASYFMIVDRYGLPMHSMQAQSQEVLAGKTITVINPGVFLGGLDAPRGLKPNIFRVNRFPLEPIWLGFTADTLFYAAILGGLVLALGRARTRLRLRRGLCPACGYDLAGNTTGVCPECGAPAPRPSGTG